MIAKTGLAPKVMDWFLSTLLFPVPPCERAVANPVMTLSLRDTALKHGFDDHKRPPLWGSAVGEAVQSGPEKPACVTCVVNTQALFFFKPFFSGPIQDQKRLQETFYQFSPSQKQV